MTKINQDIVGRVLSRAKEMKVSPRQLSILSGHGPDLIRDWKREKAPLPRLDSLQKLAEVMGVKAGWLAFGDNFENRIVGREVPLISWVAASRYADTGDATSVEDAPRIVVDSRITARAFALRVIGDSMNRIADEGAVIVVDPEQTDLLPRKYYVFASSEGVTFKRYMAQPPRIEPFSTNTSHEALEITPDTRVIGRVVSVTQTL